MELISKTIGRLEVGPGASFENLTVVPLLDGAGGAPRYETLDEALASGHARVTEVSESGSVPELAFKNEGPLPVFLLDGEELVGAKQNRVLNLSILAPAGRAITIPVSCVEAGRWRHETPAFKSSKRAHFASGRASKNADVSLSLLRSGSRVSDQGKVWAEIDDMMCKMDVQSPSSAMSDVFESRAPRLGDFSKAIKPAEGQVGAVFVVNGEVRGLDLFDCPDTLAKLLPKLIESYALDALAARKSEQTASPPNVEDFLAVTAAADSQHFPAVGEGEDVRLTGEHLAGGALVADDKIVHLCAFKLRDGDNDNIGYPSARRRSRGRDFP